MTPSNLPPGCTDRDIDPPMVDCPECEGDGQVWDDGAPDAVPIKCPDCDGAGEVRKDSVEE